MQKAFRSVIDQKGLFLSTREDYKVKIIKLLNLVKEKYPELEDTENYNMKFILSEGNSLENIIDFYNKLYQKLKEFNSPKYKPNWIFKTKFYS